MNFLFNWDFFSGSTAVTFRAKDIVWKHCIWTPDDLRIYIKLLYNFVFKYIYIFIQTQLVLVCLFVCLFDILARCQDEDSCREAGNFASSEILVLLGQNGCGKAPCFVTGLMQGDAIIGLAIFSGKLEPQILMMVVLCSDDLGHLKYVSTGSLVKS